MKHKKQKQKQKITYWKPDFWKRGRGSERLGKDPKGRDDKFANFAYHCLSRVPSLVLGALEEFEKRGKMSICVWLSWDTTNGKQRRCSLFIIHTLHLYALLTFQSTLTSQCKLHVYKTLGINNCYLCAQTLSESQPHWGGWLPLYSFRLLWHLFLSLMPVKLLEWFEL